MRGVGTLDQNTPETSWRLLSPSYVTLFWLPYFLNNPFKLLTLDFGFDWKNEANIFLLKPVQLPELIVWRVTEGYVWKGTWTVVVKSKASPTAQLSFVISCP